MLMRIWWNVWSFVFAVEWTCIVLKRSSNIISESVSHRGADSPFYRKPVFLPLYGRGGFGSAGHAAHVVRDPCCEEDLWGALNHWIIRRNYKHKHI